MSEFPPTVILDLENPAEGAAAVRPDGTVVLLICGMVDPNWAAEAVIRLVTAWTKDGRRMVLADLQLENPRLHREVGVANLEGAVDIFAYGASLSRIAKPVKAGDFLFIPAGTYAPDPAEIYRHPRWRKLVAGFRESDAGLALYVPAEGADLEALGRWSGEAILFGAPPDADFVRRIRRAGLRLLGTLEPSGTSNGRRGPRGPGPSRESRWRTVETPRKLAAVRAPPRAGARNRPQSLDLDLEVPPPPVRSRHERNRASLLLWIFFGVILLGTVWYLIAAFRYDMVPGIQPVDPPPDLAAAVRQMASPDRQGELLPYSVHVKAFTTLEAAQAEMAVGQRRLPDAPFMISPEEIQGVLYFRILAGLSPDTSGAIRLRDRLVDSELIDPEDATGSWNLLQFTPLAFDLGEFNSPQQASVRADSLLLSRVPTYSAAVPYSDGSQRWQLYAGAYADSASASHMRQFLQSAGLPSRLVARTGLPVTLGE